MLKNRNLSVNDKKRLVLLATREIEGHNVPLNEKERDEKSVKETVQTKKANEKKSNHAPKDTATFLALFNNPQGFKFLTHDFDPDSDMDYERLMSLTRDCFEQAKKKYQIPPSLYAVINAFLNGGQVWTDCDGNSHRENYNTASWVEWARKNPKTHLLSNESFQIHILKFRSTIRLVKPALCDIVKRQEAKHSGLNIHTENLEKADFYTYVWFLECGIEKILNDMSRYADKTPDVNVSFERQFGDEFSYRTIRITQIGSVSYALDDVLKRFHSSNSGEDSGQFNVIKKYLRGYCNWSVEALWDGVPKRWNILTDDGRPELESMENTDLIGFTHILTYYSK